MTECQDCGRVIKKRKHQWTSAHKKFLRAKICENCWSDFMIDYTDMKQRYKFLREQMKETE